MAVRRGEVWAAGSRLSLSSLTGIDHPFFPCYSDGMGIRSSSPGGFSCSREGEYEEGGKESSCGEGMLEEEGKRVGRQLVRRSFCQLIPAEEAVRRIGLPGAAGSLPGEAG